jgi:hypothetical protein
MLRSLSIILIFIAFITQTFSRFVIQLDYYSNTASFEQNCENKTKPAMHCHGKCQMLKKLRAEEKKDQQNAERKPGYKNEVISSRSFFATYVHYRSGGNDHLGGYYIPCLPVIEPADIFHPPSA